jgi:hypothetical protein
MDLQVDSAGPVPLVATEAALKEFPGSSVAESAGGTLVDDSQPWLGGGRHVWVLRVNGAISEPVRDGVGDVVATCSLVVVDAETGVTLFSFQRADPR